MHKLQRFERMLVHRFAIVLLLLFDIASSVKAGGCFAPDTTWAADINQGITNITTKVVFSQLIVNQILVLAGGMSDNLPRILFLSRIHPFQRKSLSLCQLLRNLPHNQLIIYPLLQLCERTQLMHMLRSTFLKRTYM